MLVKKKKNIFLYILQQKKCTSVLGSCMLCWYFVLDKSGPG